MICCLEGHDGSLDDVDALAQLVLVDDEGRSQSDDVAVGGLGKQSVVTEPQADLPGIVVWTGYNNKSVTNSFYYFMSFSLLFSESVNKVYEISVHKIEVAN